MSDHEEEPWFRLSCELPFADSSLNSTDTIMADRRAPIGRRSSYLNCMNACSIVNKRWDLQALLTSEKVDVVAITETFLSEDILNSELVDETSFTVFRRDRNRHGGGVMLVL